MKKSIREVLSPLLMISYVCGLAQFPTNDPRKWFNILYMLLLWSFYTYLLIYKVIPHTIHYTIVYHICVGTTIFTTFLSIAVGMYHEKTFRNCIRKITIIDNTLEELGTTTDYHKLRIRTAWIILGWSVTIALLTYAEFRFLKDYNYDIVKAICVPLIRNYYFYINLIGDLTITRILGYIGLKFDQINEHLETLAKGNKHKIRQAWEHSVLLSYQPRFSEAPSSEWMIWIIMHLYLELHKISREINSVFGTQMTLEMLCYFTVIASSLQEMFKVILIKDYFHTFVTHSKVLHEIVVQFWFFIFMFRLLLINRAYESVCTKASAVRNSINRLSYSTCNIKVRENILQLLLEMSQSPLRFYGLGLFQFGFKFFYRFTTSVATLLVLIIQSYTDK